MQTNQPLYAASSPRRIGSFSVGIFRLNRIPLIAVLCVFTVFVAHSQERTTSADLQNMVATASPAMMASSLTTDSFASSATSEVPAYLATTEAPSMMEPFARKEKTGKEPVASELILEGMVSYGNWQVFGNGPECKLYFAGIEYNRHSWGHAIGAQLDYVAEVLPFVLLSQPAKLNYYGIKRSNNYVFVPGAAVAPIGIRFQWLSKRKIKPYLELKGGMVGFTQKALSPNATYQNFTFQSSIGAQVMMNERWGLRLGLFNDFHFSDFFVVGTNPGLDVMNSNLGLSYHFKK